ncbi:MAG: ParB N-terminal domain-containing protein, partial [Pseudomonadota bacterium]
MDTSASPPVEIDTIDRPLENTTPPQCLPLRIKSVPIDSLHLDPSNVRTHDTRNLDAISASLKRFGQAEPLVVQQRTGRVIGGNGRLQAMKQLGWTQCEIVELDLDDLQATSLSIALNRTGELAGWDEPALAKAARRKFKQRSRTTRDPPPRFYPLRATPSTRPQPPARTDPRPHATAFPPREHTAPA